MLPMIAVRLIGVSSIRNFAVRTVGRDFIRMALRSIRVDSDREEALLEARRIVYRFLKSLRVKVDIGPAQHHLANVQRRIAYAKAIALTKTAKRLQAMAEDEVSKVFSKPTKYVRNGFYVQSASVSKPVAVIGIKDRQAKILLPHISGGSRDRKPFEQRLASDDARASGYWVPGQGVKLNAEGNLTKGQIKQIVAGLSKSGRYGDVFVGKPLGIPNAPYGIWARRSKNGRRIASLTPLLIKIEKPNYRKRFDFYGIVEKNAQRIFNEEFNRSFRA